MGKCIDKKGKTSYQRVQVFRRWARDSERALKTESYQLDVPAGFTLLGEKPETPEPSALVGTGI